MIVERNEHPGLRTLQDGPFACHLVGSRRVGVFSRESDYDFLIVADGLYGDNGLLRWMEGAGFSRDRETYGKDPRLLSSDVWTQSWDGFPSIDLIPVTPIEAEIRLRFFDAMELAGDRRAGLLAKALKTEKAWPHLWSVVGEQSRASTAEGGSQ